MSTDFSSNFLYNFWTLTRLPSTSKRTMQLAKQLSQSQPPFLLDSIWCGVSGFQNFSFVSTKDEERNTRNR